MTAQANPGFDSERQSFLVVLDTLQDSYFEADVPALSELDLREEL